MDSDEIYADCLYFWAFSDEKCFNSHLIIFGPYLAFFAQKWPFLNLTQLLELTRGTKHRWIWMKPMLIVYFFEPVQMKSLSTPIQSFFGLHWAFFAQKCPFFTLIQLLELTRRTKHRWIWMNSMSIVYLFRPVKKSFLTPHSIMFWPYWAFFWQ